MANKKTFKADINPAMQFISAPSEETRQETTQHETANTNKPQKRSPPLPPFPTPTAPISGGFPSTSLTKQEDTTAPTQTGKPPVGYRMNPLYIETKSRRLQLLVQPSLHAKLKARAETESKSINDLVHSILEDALKEE
jgi:hypothetical protein